MARIPSRNSPISSIRRGECKKAGLKLCYHNHAFEYQPYGSKFGLEMMMEGTDKNLVGLELDAFWASVGGHDPVELLNQYKGRVDLMHIKDKDKVRRCSTTMRSQDSL